MSGTTSVYSLGSGTASVPGTALGIVAAAPDGVAGFFDFRSTDWNSAKRNLYNYGLSGVIVGSPTLPGGYAAFPGASDTGLNTRLMETADFGILALVRGPGLATAGNRRILSNYQSTGSYLTYNNAGALSLSIGIEGGVSTGALSGQDITGWTIVAGKVAGTSRRIRNLTTGANSTGTVSGTRALAATDPIYLGGKPGFASTPAEIQILAGVLTLGRAPTDEEERANALQLRALAAAVGITVAVA